MRHRWILRAGAAVAALATAVVVQGPIGALASTAGPPPAGSTGHDISWPQCGASYPTDGSFGIVGVSDGRAWSTNPCLASEYWWAAGYPRTPDLYMNTANPAPTSSYYWPTSGTSDPALCTNATVTNDPGCAYDYGWHTAANALATATSTLGTSAVGYWWLDVETGNTWNGDASSNAADVQGSIDYLLSQGVAGVGVYSTEYQWTTITGGYSTSNQSQYAAAWSSEFTSSNGISHSPSWVAGASGPSDAPTHCSSFLATTTWLVQYVASGFDVDYACDTTAPQAADYSIALPLSVSAAAGGSINETVSLTPTNGWSGTLALSVSVSKGSQVAATLSSSSVALSANGSATTTLTLHGIKAGTYTVTVTAQPSSTSSTTTTHSASTSFTVTGTRHKAGIL